MRVARTEQEEKQMGSVLTSILEHIPPSFISVWRFDLKADSLEELLLWNLKIIECNAWGGIPTIVYDEVLTIKDKYLLLHKHFGTMNDIAKNNKANNSVIKTLIMRPELLYISY